jgi:hypothetical protein
MKILYVKINPYPMSMTEFAIKCQNKPGHLQTPRAKMNEEHQLDL